MAKTFVFDRFDLQPFNRSGFDEQDVIAAGDGAWVRADDAIGRSMSLEAAVRVMEVQLKDRQTDLAAIAKLLQDKTDECNAIARSNQALGLRIDRAQAVLAGKL